MSENWNQLQAAYSLNEATKRQQIQIDALLSELRQLVRSYQQTLDALPEQIERGVNRALPEAAETAAKSIAANWTAANNHAEAATLAYDRAKHVAPWLIFGSIGSGFLLMGVIGLFIALKLLPSADQITQLRMEEQELRTTIGELEKKGGRTSFTYCDDQKGNSHLCVRVDQHKKSVAPGYQIVYGR